MKLVANRVIKGSILCQTGLHIGGSQDQIEIGGVDLLIIKHPLTLEPYIPGSSLKGKMRSQLEKKLGRIREKGEPCGCGNCPVCQVFGPHKNTRHNLGPTRILVRDANLHAVSKELFQKTIEKGISFIEKKTENVINRKTGTAEHPRTQERVPAGTQFNLNIILQVFEGDNEADMKDKIRLALKLVEESYLGGFGSRGSGQVIFKDLTIDGQPFTLE